MKFHILTSCRQPLKRQPLRRCYSDIHVPPFKTGFHDLDYGTHAPRLHYIDFPSLKPECEFDRLCNQKTLICLHGAYQSNRFADDFVQAIHDRHGEITQDLRIICPDQRGHGDSSWAEGAERYEVQLFRDDLKHFIKEQELTDFYILGASMGGLVALDLASSIGPGSGHLGTITVDIAPHLNVDQIIRSKNKTSHLSGFEEYVEWAKEFNPQRDEQILRHRLQYALKETSEGEFVWKHDPKFDIQNGFMHSDLEVLFQQIKGLGKRHNCLVVRGETSTVTSKENLKELYELLGGHTIMEDIPDSGHSVAGDNPKALAESVLKFMDVL